MKTDVSVALVVTLLNEIDALPSLLTSIEVQESVVDHVVFVDGGSVDGTEELLSSWCEQSRTREVIFAPGCNIASGRNIGIASVNADIILTTDAGCLLHKDWATNMIAALFRERADSVKGTYLLQPNRTRWSRGLAYAAAPRMSRFASPSALASSRSFGFRRQAWARVGGYPESLETAEDTLFAQRLAASGPVAFASAAVAFWSVRPTVKQTYRQYYRYAQGDLLAGTNGRLLRRTVISWLTILGAGSADRPLGVVLGAIYLARRLFGRRSTSVTLTPSTAIAGAGAIIVMDAGRLAATAAHFVRKGLVWIP